MDNEKEYITVAQYAEIKGITKQAVYKRLNNQLKPFLIMVDSKKCLKIEVLKEDEKERLNQVEQPLNNFEQPLNNPFQPILEKQLAEKDRTIASLLRQVENLQEQNSKLTELLSNSQYLLAAEQQKCIEQSVQVPPQETEEEQPTPKEKKGFFARLKQNLKK